MGPQGGTNWSPDAGHHFPFTMLSRQGSLIDSDEAMPQTSPQAREHLSQDRATLELRGQVRIEGGPQGGGGVGMLKGKVA
jgi:hypothetical protein